MTTALQERSPEIISTPIEIPQESFYTYINPDGTEGGQVHSSAIIGEGAVVHPGAQVRAGAKVGGDAEIGPGAWICRNSYIPPNTSVAGTLVVKQYFSK